MISCDNKAELLGWIPYIHVNFSYLPGRLSNLDGQQILAVVRMLPFHQLFVFVPRHALHQRIHFLPRQKNRSMMNRHLMTTMNYQMSH